MKQREAHRISQTAVPLLSRLNKTCVMRVGSLMQSVPEPEAGSDSSSTSSSLWPRRCACDWLLRTAACSSARTSKGMLSSSMRPASILLKSNTCTDPMHNEFGSRHAQNHEKQLHR